MTGVTCAAGPAHLARTWPGLSAVSRSGLNRAVTTTEPGEVDDPVGPGPAGLDEQDLQSLQDLSGEPYRSLDVLARALHLKDAALQPTLDAIVSGAVRATPAAQHAGLILVERGVLVPQSTVGRPPLVLDLLQRKLGVGPCLDAAATQTANRIDDTHTEVRWPDFTRSAVELGVGSVLCVPLWFDERRLGALSLYSDHRHAFNDQDEHVTSLFGTLAALALAGAQRQDQMLAALANRDVIGQAKGILMERHRITSDGAFKRLTHASQTQNRKLVDIAIRLVETGEVLGETS